MSSCLRMLDFETYTVDEVKVPGGVRRETEEDWKITLKKGFECRRQPEKSD